MTAGTFLLQHRLALEAREAEQRRAERDADYAQKLRHEKERTDAAVLVSRATTDEELRRAAALKGMEVDLTR
jgi:hypothetical protein